MVFNRKKQFEMIKNAVEKNPELGETKIGDQSWLIPDTGEGTSSFSNTNGINAYTFTEPNGDISIVFRGTGLGEWIDDGDGLVGIPEENTYYTYDSCGKVLNKEIIEKDFATDQQVEALN